MGKEYEIKFRLDAETDSSFSKAFTSASSDFRQLQAQVSDLSRGRGVNKGLLGSLLDPFRRNMRQTQADAKKTASAAENMFGLIKKAGAGVAGFLAVRNVLNLGKDFVQTFANFEQGMANVRAVSGLGKTSKDFELLTAKAREMGERTSKTASEAADGLQYLALAGWNTEQMLAGIEPVLRLSEAGAMDLGRASDLATDSMAALGLEVKDLPAYLDKVAQASRRSNTSVEQLMDAFLVSGGTFKTLNVPLEEATSLLGTLANRGYKGSEAGTAMNVIITNLTSGMGQAGKAMKELEISAFDSKGRFQGLEKVFLEVKGKVDKMTDSQRSQYIAMIAGKEHLKTFTGLLDGLGKEYGGLKKDVKNSGGALMEMAETQMDTLSGSMKLMESAFESAKISLGEKFAPTVRRVVDDITTRIPQAMGELESLMDGPAWKNADLFGKMRLAWDKIIGEPLAAWWDSSGRQQVAGVAKEIGKMVWSGISGLAKESLGALSGSPTGILAAGALAVPTTKVVKGTGKIVKSLAGMTKAGTGAASSMGIVARSTGLIGPAIGALANPIGLTVAGIGALAGGWYLYRKHQEKARQDLIRMGDALKKSLGDYSAVENQTQKTKDLITEYDRLKGKIADSETPAAQLTEAKRKLRDVEKELIEMYPEILSNHDIENGKLEEKIGLIGRLSKAELDEAKLKLEKDIADNQGNKGKLEDEIINLRNAKEKQTIDKERFLEASVAMKEIENEWTRLINSGLETWSEEWKQKSSEIIEQANEVGKEFGHTFSNLGEIRGSSDYYYKQYRENLDALVTTNDELKAAEESYKQLYDAQVKLIELNLGGSIEEQSKKIYSLTDKGKKHFYEAQEALNKLNNSLFLLPDHKKIKVDVDVDYKTPGIPTVQHKKERYGIPEPAIKLPQFADGGFSNQPSIFGEAGWEVAIPINNKQRSHDLLEKTNRIMGHTSGEGNEINVTWAPQITVQGGGVNVKQEVSQLLKQAQTSSSADSLP